MVKLISEYFDIPTTFSFDVRIDKSGGNGGNVVRFSGIWINNNADSALIIGSQGNSDFTKAIQDPVIKIYKKVEQ